MEIEEAYRHALGTTNFRKWAQILDSSNVPIRVWTNTLLSGSRVSRDSQVRIKGTGQIVSREANLELDDYDDLVLASQPLFYWKLNESAGTNANDSTSNNRDGTYQNTPLFSVPGLLAAFADTNETATEFRSAQSEYVSIAHSANFNSARFTVALWIKTTGSNMALMDRDDGGSNRYVRVGLDASGNVYATLTFTTPTTVTFTATAAINDGEPHFVVVTYDQSKVKIYVDSIKLLSTAETRTLASPTAAWNLGRTLAGTLHYNGVAAHAKVYDRDLSETEVRNKYQAGSGDLSEIDYTRDRIKVYLGIRMPYNGTDGTPWADVPLMVLLPSSPSRVAEGTAVIASADCFDQTIILENDRVTDRYTVAAGTKYLTAVTTVAQSAGFDTSSWNLTPIAAGLEDELPALREWPIGTPKLDIINGLLESVNYEELWFDGNGNGVCEPKRLPDQRSAEITLETNSDSIILFGVEENLDISSVPNIVIRAVAEAERAILSSIATNDSFSSPTSTTRRRNATGPIQVVDYDTVDAADQTTLDAITEQALSDLSQVFQENRVPILYYPFFGHIDCVQLNHNRLGTSAKSITYGWDIPLGPDDYQMEVSMRAAVSVV